jgi:hypothetical protein
MAKTKLRSRFGGGVAGSKPAFSRAWTGIFGGSGGPGHGARPLQIQAQAIALASDEAHNVLKAYGVWQQKTSYGRKFMGTVLIIPDQHIGPKVLGNQSGL